MRLASPDLDCKHTKTLNKGKKMEIKDLGSRLHGGVSDFDSLPWLEFAAGDFSVWSIAYCPVHASAFYKHSSFLPCSKKNAIKTN